MPDLFQVLTRWWKQILLLVMLSLLIATVVVLLLPRQYMSAATALPASSLNTDKSKIFNENIQALYSELGSPDELERIIGTAQLDTIYLAIAAERNLTAYYNITGPNAWYKTAQKLRKKTKTGRSEYGELKVRVWDKNKDTAASLANAIMQRLQAMHQRFQNENNQSVLKGLKQNRDRIAASLDSLSAQNRAADITDTRRKVLLDQVAQHEKLIQQYELMVATNPPVLLQVEAARPAVKPDKPERLSILLAVGFISTLFSFFLALFLDRKKNIGVL